MKSPNGFGKNYFTFASFLTFSIQTALVNSKPCHCDCFFKLKTKIALLINIFIPRCPYYTTYFAFRRTGVHPPL
ncbi:hypothetical protein FJR48_06705 [Sulfurimonas lithotrophica]|uniref:Uncharacterized protein n=1 Tax=Sulfurimonas lithotrophica TaxID=2590022 RepID=A0A5P8P145_9BACT|nr:hypothetical protein [Sulfurimonas lithotrophica]QFR49432.1 hypothetical protein FJR48_06705 [Sulfurimonas lithotrophica]